MILITLQSSKLRGLVLFEETGERNSAHSMWQYFAVVPNIRTYKMLSESMRQVYQELCRLRDCSTMDARLITKVELLSDLFVGISEDASRGELEKEEDLIAEMERR